MGNKGYLGDTKHDCENNHNKATGARHEQANQTNTM